MISLDIRWLHLKSFDCIWYQILCLMKFISGFVRFEILKRERNQGLEGGDFRNVVEKIRPVPWWSESDTLTPRGGKRNLHPLPHGECPRRAGQGQRPCRSRRSEIPLEKHDFWPPFSFTWYFGNNSNLKKCLKPAWGLGFSVFFRVEEFCFSNFRFKLYWLLIFRGLKLAYR